MKKIYMFFLLNFQLIFSFSQSVYMVSDIRLGEFSSYPNNFNDFDNKLIFVATSNEVSNELFIYNGINEPYNYDLLDYGIYDPDNFVNFNENLYFTAEIASGEIAQWIFNGEDEPCILMQNPIFTNPIVFENKLYFGHNQLWVYDGVNSPEMITNYSNFHILFNFVLNNQLYLYANNNNTVYNFWLFDGINSINKVTNINEDLQYTNYKKSICDNKLFYSCERYTNEYGIGETELWYFDGYSNPVMLDIYPGTYLWWNPIDNHYVECNNSANVDKIKAFNGKIYFQANNASDSGLFVYDLISPPHLCSDLFFDFSWSCYIDFFEVYNNSLFFRASSDGINYGLWKYDGQNPPSLICEIDHLLSLTNVNNKLYFSATDWIHGDELWCYEEPLNINNFPNNEAKIILFPNPCIDNLNIDFSNITSNKYILQIFNIQGVCVYYSELMNYNNRHIILNIADYIEGIYLLKIITEQNIINQTFIKTN